MNIALVCGSVRENSLTHASLKQLETQLISKDIQLDLIDFRETPLPIFDGTDETRKSAESFVRRIDQASGLIIASPEYHNSFSGVLKNAFDYVTYQQIKNKPIGIMAISGGGKGGINCLNGMRTFLRGLYGLVLPDQVVIDADQFNKMKMVTHQNTFDKVIGLANEVLLFAKQIEKIDQVYS